MTSLNKIFIINQKIKKWNILSIWLKVYLVFNKILKSHVDPLNPMAMNYCIMLKSLVLI